MALLPFTFQKCPTCCRWCPIPIPYRHCCVTVIIEVGLLTLWLLVLRCLCYYAGVATCGHSGLALNKSGRSLISSNSSLHFRLSGCLFSQRLALSRQFASGQRPKLVRQSSPEFYAEKLQQIHWTGWISVWNCSILYAGVTGRLEAGHTHTHLIII